MKPFRYLAIILSTLFLFCASVASASNFLILEVQTTGAGGAYDEFVKIQNNTGQTINLSGYRLQSQSSSGGNWINRTGTDGLPSLTVDTNQIFIIASKDYNGAGEIYRHTARWGFSDTGGGIRFLDAEGNNLAEEHWSESSGLVVFHQPITSAVPPAEEDAVSNEMSDITPDNAETPTSPPPYEGGGMEGDAASLDLSAEALAEAEESSVVPEGNSVSEGAVIYEPKSESIPESTIVSNSAEVQLPTVTKTAKAEEESAIKPPSASPFEKGGLRGISEIKKLKNDSKVKIRGVVSVPPSVLGGQIFYLSGSGIQIYMFKKDFPDLKIGDTVDIEGTLSEAYGEKRIKLTSRDSIRFVSSGEAPTPHEIVVNEIGESMEGSLVKISGEIIEIKKDFWYLADGEKEIEVLLKEGANIPFDLVKEGDKVQITGIVSQYNEEYRLLPRSVDDIKILKKNNSEILTQENQNKRSFGVKDYLFVGIPSLLLAGFLVVRRKIKSRSQKTLSQRHETPENMA